MDVLQMLVQGLQGAASSQGGGSGPLGALGGLASMLGGGGSSSAGASSQGNPLGDMLNMLLSSQSAPGGGGGGGILSAIEGMLGGAAGGGATAAAGAGAAGILQQIFTGFTQAHGNNSPYSGGTSSNEERARRLVYAMVFAAKSDGQIDQQEQQGLSARISQMNLGPQVNEWVQDAVQQPLDPNIIASGVNNEHEALEVYLMSYSAINPDQFMERNYLDALAKALHIPDNVKATVEQQARSM